MNYFVIIIYVSIGLSCVAKQRKVFYPECLFQIYSLVICFGFISGLTRKTREKLEHRIHNSIMLIKFVCTYFHYTRIPLRVDVFLFWLVQTYFSGKYIILPGK